jgi:hypothetical protein
VDVASIRLTRQFDAVALLDLLGHATQIKTIVVDSSSLQRSSFGVDALGIDLLGG